MFNEKIVVRHKNGIPSDNSFDNILVGSQQENMLDKLKTERIQNASNPIYDHEAILNDRESGLTYKELMGKYNIKSKGTVSFIVNNSLQRLKKQKNSFSN